MEINGQACLQCPVLLWVVEPRKHPFIGENHILLYIAWSIFCDEIVIWHPQNVLFQHCPSHLGSWYELGDIHHMQRASAGLSLQLFSWNICDIFECIPLCQWEFQDPYIGLIYGRYLQFRNLTWPLIVWLVKYPSQRKQVDQRTMKTSWSITWMATWSMENPHGLNRKNNRCIDIWYPWSIDWMGRN